jgi:hypothetical protein
MNNQLSGRQKRRENERFANEVETVWQQESNDPGTMLKAVIYLVEARGYLSVICGEDL